MGHARNRAPFAAATSGPGGFDHEAAASVAAVLQGLATPSRLHLIEALRGGPMNVGELADAVAMEQSAVSHQLRHLRELGFVTSRREGRTVVYDLLDDHVVEIIDQALAHGEHLRQAREQDPS